MKVYCCVFGVNPLMVHSIRRKKNKKQKTSSSARTEMWKYHRKHIWSTIFVCTNTAAFCLHKQEKHFAACLYLSPQTCLNAFTPRWWYSICYDGRSHLSRRSAPRRLTEQLWSEISEVDTDGVKGGCIRSFLGSACSRTSHTLLLQNEMDDMFGFKCIFNRTVSSHLS